METAATPWTYVRIICYHQWRKGASEQFGLSFIHFSGGPPTSKPIFTMSPRGIAECNRRYVSHSFWFPFWISCSDSCDFHCWH